MNGFVLLSLTSHSQLCCFETVACVYRIPMVCIVLLSTELIRIKNLRMVLVSFTSFNLTEKLNGIYCLIMGHASLIFSTLQIFDDAYVLGHKPGKSVAPADPVC